MQNYHNNAKLTTAKREFIQKCSDINFSKMAAKFNGSKQTIAKNTSNEISQKIKLLYRIKSIMLFLKTNKHLLKKIIQK
jgi:hypothetical protein